MEHAKEKPNFLIVGAGISGLALALLLSRQGHQVAIYDRRNVFDQAVDGRSINLTISGRGLAVLEQLGVKEQVLAESAVLVGRLIHLSHHHTVRYPYGIHTSHVLLSIQRSKLIAILLKAIEAERNIHFHPGLMLENILEPSLTCQFINTHDHTVHQATADVIVGADGVFSTVRQFLLKKQIASHQQTVFSWGYKEYYFSTEDAKKLSLDPKYMHMWPKKNSLLVAIPNQDQTFSVILTAPLYNAEGFRNHFDDIARQEHAAIVQQAPSFWQYCGNSQSNYLISIKTDAWHWQDRIVLLGDACHATYPFYGQGMNSALEDANILYQYLHHQALDRKQAFIGYSQQRKIDTNALHQLSEGHLGQMTKAMMSPYNQANSILDNILAKSLPRYWMYEYAMIAHSIISYKKVLDDIKKQNRKKYMNGFFIVKTILGSILWVKTLFRHLLRQVSEHFA